MYARVAISLTRITGTYDYHIPEKYSNTIQPGQLITVPFGSQMVQALVISLEEQAEVVETRPITDLVDPEPVLTKQQIKLAHWLQNQTLSPLNECLQLMIPTGLAQHADSLYSLLQRPDETPGKLENQLLDLLARRGALRGRQLSNAFRRQNWKKCAERLVRQGFLQRRSILPRPSARAQYIRTARLAVHPQTARELVPTLGRAGSNANLRRIQIIEILIAEGEPLDVTWVYAESGAKLPDLRVLEEHGLVILGESEVWRDPLATLDFTPSTPPPLTPEQQLAWAAIQSALQADHAPQRPFLLHGVTGSGKTELYMQAVAQTLALGRGALILVPEIALTPQTIRRFVARFPGQVGLFHSRLSPGERYDTWRRARAGTLPIIIGARSALFAPLPDVGLIVLDESHDQSYKESGNRPSYHARDAAIAYAAIHQAVCLFGTATPDLGTSYQADLGKISRIHLPHRILGHRKRLNGQSSRLGIKPKYHDLDNLACYIDLPPVRVVDMRQELKAGNRSLFSRPLHNAIHETLQAGQQVILFLNRRGSATYIFCRDCGFVIKCPGCDLPLTFHESRKLLICHHCGYKRKPVVNCPECASARIKAFGTGTQKIDAAVQELFPDARTLRWDRDATLSKNAHEIILGHFAAHRADILIGTQMIAKGLDLPLVTLVGVVLADVGLNLPDFRAAERTFQTLTQVSGRAGRGLLGGKVILQTYQPDHYVIQAASRHDHESFYQQELELRRALNYPPFTRLTRLIYQHSSNQEAERQARHMEILLRRNINIHQQAEALIGPAPCYFSRIQGRFRWHIILRARYPERILPGTLPEGWKLDLDPVTLL